MLVNIGKGLNTRGWIISQINFIIHGLYTIIYWLVNWLEAACTFEIRKTFLHLKLIVTLLNTSSFQIGISDRIRWFYKRNSVYWLLVVTVLNALELARVERFQRELSVFKFTDSFQAHFPVWRLHLGRCVRSPQLVEMLPHFDESGFRLSIFTLQLQVALLYELLHFLVFEAGSLRINLVVDTGKFLV